MFCLDDGAELLYGPARSEPGATATGFSSDEPQTAILHSTAAPDEPQTRAQIYTSSETAILPTAPISSASQGATKKGSIIAGVLGILLVTALGIGSYIYYGRGSSRQIESIAVMPFVNDGGNADVEYLSDGMTETLNRSLSQLAGLQVKPRSTIVSLVRSAVKTFTSCSRADACPTSANSCLPADSTSC